MAVVTQRSEPVLDVGPVPVNISQPERRLEASPPPAEIVPDAEPVARSASSPAGSDQLGRIEDKAARIEEKFARQEATAQRVLDKFDAAASRMSEVASQAEMTAVRGEVAAINRRVRTLPGFSALLVTGIVTSVVTAVLVVAVMKYAPGLLAR